MANFASINSEFSDVSDLESTFKIRFVNTTRAIDLTFTWICKSLRSASFQYAQGEDVFDQGNEARIAVSADIASSSISSFMQVSTFDVDFNFEIEANEYGWTITDEGGIGASNVTLTEVPEVVPAKNFELTGFSIAEAADPCADIQVTIEENDGVAPYTWITPSNASITLVADIARAASDQLITVTLEDDETDQASINNVTIPRIFTSSEIADIAVVTNPGGLDATVTILMGTQDFGTYLFSIDGLNYTVSNVFENVTAGSYVLSVNDGYGCVVTTNFDVVLPAVDNYFRVAKLNAIEFKIPDSKRQNFNNTLFVDMAQPHRVQTNKYCQVYFDNELVPAQFQSNFSGAHTITVREYKGADLAVINPVMVYDSPEEFKYYEFTVNMALYSNKTIQITIVPDGVTLGDPNSAISEPIQVISSDPENKYVKVQYQSNVNCSDVYWVSGFSPFFYFEGEVADTFPLINKEVSRDCYWNTNTQSRELMRQIRVTAKQQPHYIFEKLQWALGNGQGPGNYYAINDMWVNSEEGAWEEPDFPDKYSLADSEAKLEQRDVFTGDLSTTPAPPITINYLLVNPGNNGGLLVGPNDEYLVV